jgi:hypothetical protein
VGRQKEGRNGKRQRETEREREREREREIVPRGITSSYMSLGGTEFRSRSAFEKFML